MLSLFAKIFLNILLYLRLIAFICKLTTSIVCKANLLLKAWFELFHKTYKFWSVHIFCQEFSSFFNLLRNSFDIFIRNWLCECVVADVATSFAQITNFQPYRNKYCAEKPLCQLITYEEGLQFFLCDLKNLTNWNW